MFFLTKMMWIASLLTVYLITNEFHVKQQKEKIARKRFTFCGGTSA